MAINREEAKKTFGKNLRKARKSKNLTQEELAEAIDVTPGTISSYESGHKEAGIACAKQIATALNVSLDTLFDIEPCDQYRQELKNAPIVALLTALELFQFQVAVAEDNTITLSMGENRAGYSATEIKKFFKEYEILQSFARSNGKSDAGKEMVEKLRAHLQEKFSHLPGWGEYESIK